MGAELSLPLTSCSIQESRPCTSPEQHNRVDSGQGCAGEPALRVIEREQDRLPLCLEVPGKSEMLLLPCLSPLKAVGRVNPKVMRVGKLTRPHTGEHTCPGQHSRIDLGQEGVCEPAPKGKITGELSLSLICHEVAWVQTPSTLVTCR